VCLTRHLGILEGKRLPLFGYLNSTRRVRSKATGTPRGRELMITCVLRERENQKRALFGGTELGIGGEKNVYRERRNEKQRTATNGNRAVLGYQAWRNLLGVYGGARANFTLVRLERKKKMKRGKEEKLLLSEKSINKEQLRI